MLYTRDKPFRAKIIENDECQSNHRAYVCRVAACQNLLNSFIPLGGTLANTPILALMNSDTESKRAFRTLIFD